jgi:hypothetical protein
MFQSSHQPKVKKHYDELSTDHRFQSMEEMFKIYFFLLQQWISYVANYKPDLLE